MNETKPSGGLGSDWVLTPSIWLNSAHVEQWLRSIWPSWRYDEIREQWDTLGRWFWIIPDYQRGRSRVLGIVRGLLEEVTVTRLKHILIGANWLERIESENLLVLRDANGEFRVETWNPEIEEAWFTDPRVGNYVTYRTAGRSIASGLHPARLPDEFLALHGATWSAMGPRNPRDPRSYSPQELRDYLPVHVTTA